MTYQLKTHAVIVQRIETILPLIAGGGSNQVLAPDAGILLRLDTGKKLKWLAEPNVPMPVPGDWYVQDVELGTTFVVPASKFASLFQEA